MKSLKIFSFLAILLTLLVSEAKAFTLVELFGGIPCCVDKTTGNFIPQTLIDSSVLSAAQSQNGGVPEDSVLNPTRFCKSLIKDKDVIGYPGGSPVCKCSRCNKPCTTATAPTLQSDLNNIVR